MHQLVTAILCLFCVTAPPFAHADTWVALGDSITHRSAHAPVAGPWTTMLAVHTGHTVINAGKDGDTTEGALQRLDRDVLSHAPDLVLIMLGANDHRPVLEPVPHYLVAPERFEHNLNELIDRIQAAGAQVMLMTNRPWVLGQSPRRRHYLLPHQRGAPLPACRKTLCIYNDIIRKVAKERSVPLVDIWQAVVSRGDGTDTDLNVLASGIDIPGDGFDGIHLGPKGHRLIAETIRDAVMRSPRTNH